MDTAGHDTAVAPLFFCPEEGKQIFTLSTGVDTSGEQGKRKPAKVNASRLAATVNGVELPVPVKGNSAVATLVRAWVATEEWAMPSATTDEVYTVKRCLRTGRILFSSCKCWQFNPRRGFEDCAHTAPVAEAAKLREIIASYSGPTWTLGALQAEDARLLAELARGDNRLIRMQHTGLGEAIARATAGEQVAA